MRWSSVGLAALLVLGCVFMGRALVAQDAAPAEPATVPFLNAEDPAAARYWSGERSTEFASEGKYSMKKVFTVKKTEKGYERPSLSVYNGFPVWPPDLSYFSEMRLDVYNPQDKSYKMECDFKDTYQYSYNYYYGMPELPAWPDGRKLGHVGSVYLEVKPGWNHLSFSLDEMAQRTGIEWHYIHLYWMHLPESTEEATLYFDNVRLVRRPGDEGKRSPLWARIEFTETPQQKVLYNFESLYELWQWDWSGRKYLVQTPGVTAGERGMQVYFGDLGAAKSATSARFGVNLTESDKKFARDVWTGWKTFGLDVYNPTKEPREATLIFTSRDAAKKQTNVERTLPLAPGENKLTVPIEGLAKDGLDLAKMYRVSLRVNRDAAGQFGWMVLDHMALMKD